MNSLSPCPSCHRHVEVGPELGPIVCPFCGATSERPAPPRRPFVSGRLSRAAVFAAGATLVGMAAACSSSTTGTDGGPGAGGKGGAGGTVASTGGGGQGGESGRGGSTAGAAGGPTDASADQVTIAIYSAPFPPTP